MRNHGQFVNGSSGRNDADIDTHDDANRAGYRYFTDVDRFKDYVRHEILALGDGLDSINDVFAVGR